MKLVANQETAKLELCEAQDLTIYIGDVLRLATYLTVQRQDM
jgi:hypothetical protein